MKEHLWVPPSPVRALPRFKQVAQQYITGRLHELIGRILPDRPYWAVKMRNGQLYSELGFVPDSNVPGKKRPFDWTIDLVGHGDIRNVAEVWLFGPPNAENPEGQSARIPLPFVEPYTAFMLKVATVDVLGGDERQLQSQLIGRVTDRASGDCSCFVWDAALNCMGTWETNVYHMGSWRDGIAPIQQMSHAVQGLRLG